MNRAALIPAMLACSAIAFATPASDDAAVTCRRAALDLAGAWTNDGFRLRERTWTGVLPVGKPALARVTLVAGNRYWFSAATNAASTNLSMDIYTETGVPVEASTYLEGPLAASGFLPRVSGSYVIAVSESSGTPVPFCLVYSFK